MIPVAAFDTETTGVDVETARIVSAAYVELGARGEVTFERTWLVDPGVPIPDEAAAIHGITTERAQADGQEVRAAIRSIAGQVVQGAVEFPLVVYNAPYDLTLLDRECWRHAGQSLLAGEWTTPVLDPFVLDKHVDRYRPGKRTLIATAATLGVPFAGTAHGALADAITAGRLAQWMLNQPALDPYTPEALYHSQIGWAVEIADSLRDHFRTQGFSGRAETVDGTWPMRRHHHHLENGACVFPCCADRAPDVVAPDHSWVSE